MTDTTRYYAHASGSGHGHVVEAASYEEAAMAFTERHPPEVGADDGVRIIVQAIDGGHEHCFVVHFDDGSVESCA